MDTCYNATHLPSDAMAIHRHREPYAALVRDGSYDEVSLSWSPL
jgi:hypothetical protein